MGTSNDSDVANDGAVSSINNDDDDKGKQYEEYEDDDYEAMSITSTTTATSTSYLAEMDGSPVNSNVEVNEVAIAANVIEVS